MADDSQSVKSALRSAFEATASRGTNISSDHQALAWDRVPHALDALVAFFEEQGIGSRDPVALECASSVSGALTLLALLWRGSTVVLLPHPGHAAHRTPLPRFLTRGLRIRTPDAAGAGGPAAGSPPASFLEAYSLEGSRPLPADSPLRRQHLILRTSGSLADPKWVVHTHAGVLQNAHNAIERLGLADSDRVLIPIPLAHMYGLGAGFLPALLAGASVELLEGANLIRYLERERAFRPTVAFLTPNLCSMLLRPRSAPAHYRHIVVAGDKLGVAAFHQAEALYRRVINVYGSTELGVICATDARQPAASASVTVGHPLAGVRLRIEPPAGSAGTEDGGELLCAHPYGFTGYMDLDGALVPAESAAGLGWYATRDLVRLHGDGAVEVLGRSDHATKRDGRLVMLAEVERALARLPGVTSAAVVLAAPTIRGRAMIAFVSAHSGADLGQLRRVAREALPPYAVPDELRVLPALPLLACGKLDRRALERTTVTPAPPETSRYQAPSPPTLPDHV